MRHGIECLGKVKDKCVRLTFDIHVGRNLLHCYDQLRFTTMARPEPMLVVDEDIVVLQMFHDVGKDDVFEHLTGHTC